MKKIILLALLAVSFTANAQKLKDLLYGGKLKNDSGTVVRKTDDLSTKIDTNSKKRADSMNLVKAKQAAVRDTSLKASTESPDSTTAFDSEDIAETKKKDDNVAPKDNNRIWKDYMDSIISTLKAEVLPDKKIKKGTYFILVDYEIGTDGQVTINNVLPSPENKFLQEQVKERLTLTAPQMNPVLLSTGKPRKVIRKYNFTLTKE